MIISITFTSAGVGRALLGVGSGSAGGGGGGGGVGGGRVMGLPLVMSVWAVVGLGFESQAWWPPGEHIAVPQHSPRVLVWRAELQGVHSPCRCAPV